MVYHDVFPSSAPHGIASVGFGFRQVVRSHAETDKPYDDIICIYYNRMPFQADASSRCGLSGNGYISMIDFKLLA